MCSSMKRGDVEDSACHHFRCRNRWQQLYSTKRRKYIYHQHKKIRVCPGFASCRAELLPRSAYVCVNLLWWWWAHAFSPHLLLPPTPPTHDAATCRPFFASFAPSAPLGGGGVLGDGCQHMRQGNSWHSITAGRMPRDSNKSEEWTHVLHDVCALRHLLCTSFYTSITNFCPFVSHRPHLLRSFCSTEIFIMKETQVSLTAFVFLMKKSKAEVLILVKMKHYGSGCGSDWSSYGWQWGASEPGHPHRSALLPRSSSLWSARSAWNDQIKY